MLFSWLALIYLITACSGKLNHGLSWLALGLIRECVSAVVILFTTPPLSSLLFSTFMQILTHRSLRASFSLYHLSAIEANGQIIEESDVSL